MQVQEHRSESPPKYGPYPGSTIAPNYHTQSSPPPPPPPLPPPPRSPDPPYPAPRETSSTHYHAPSPDPDSQSLPNYGDSSTYLSSSRPSTPRRGRGRGRRRSRSPAEATYVCVDGVCTRLETGTRTVLLEEHPGRNLAGYLILAIFVMICFNILFGLFAVIFALWAMSDSVEHSTSMQLGEVSLCFSITGILCTIIIIFIVFAFYVPSTPTT